MKKLDFESLNRDFKGEDWCSTFAYWLVVLRDPQSSCAREATEACAALSFQYEVEEQAQDAEMLIGDEELIPSVFTPIAPVTLAFQWSPFPSAIRALGPPLHLDTEKGETLAVFTPLANAKATGSTPDEKHFSFLLQHACAQAINASVLVLLIGSPGWDYNSDDFLEERPEVQKLMKDFGFVYTLRKPVPG